MTASTLRPQDHPADQLPTPPGPRLPMTLQSVLFATQRHRLLRLLHRRYGSVFAFQVFPERHVVSISDPGDIKELFSGPVTTFHAGEGNQVLKPVMGEHSVLTTDEDEHRRIRTLLTPPFTGAALRGYRGMVADIAEHEVARWPIGTPFRSHTSMQRLTFEVILRVVLGVSDSPRLAELRRTLGGVIDIGALDIFGWHNERMQRYGRWRRNQKLLRRSDELLYAEIADRRAAPDLGERTDVLSRLLQTGSQTGTEDEAPLTDAELRDQLVTLLLAGHETTATALAWCWHELSRSPETQARAATAADTGDDRYLEAVAKEAMRLRPVIYEVARRTTEPVTVGGFRVPAGTTIMPAIGVVQTDPAQHDEPETFRPERFLDGSTSPRNWLPFGGGVRRCLGAGFALMEATEVLRTVLTRYHLAPDRTRGEQVKPRNITFTPARGARVVITNR
ncbi:cytochrome P450 [Haloechinothrix halophila]|uniref:cytochrome P450 n=1 Tax=Haloechinothrix halophila TaxID=1069073 RepID=UPI000407E045|nr:cytochrome P450 [Haloechinothrix halophila]